MSQGPLPGFRDFYPQELAERAYIMRIWRDVAARYAFVEYDGPPLEALELYTRKSGDEIVGQLYSFEDKGGRKVSLRPEMTPTVARMVAGRANALRKPVRWYSIPQLFRYERQQKGRLREHFQLNVDIFGEASVSADAELLAVALDMMRAFGLGPGDIRARVSDRRLLRGLLDILGIGESSHSVVFAVIDKLERTPPDVSRERLRAEGVDPTAVDRLFLLLAIREVDALRAALGPEGAALSERLDDLDRYFAHLRALGVDDYAQLDLTIVRGLAYYTGIVFELFDARGEFRAVAGGGRYDTLLEESGGPPLPALGFGMGDVVLGELLRARGLMHSELLSAELWVAGPTGEQDLPAVMRAATALRRGGRRVEYALRPQQLSKQFKAATASGARHVVIVPGALRDGEASTQFAVRDLATGEQVSYPSIEAVVSALGARDVGRTGERVANDG